MPSSIIINDSAKVKYKPLNAPDTALIVNKTAVVFIKQKDGSNLSFYMKVSEDVTASGGKPTSADLHYGIIPESFTGMIYYYTLNRQFINGYRFEHGQTTGSISFIDQPQSQGSSLAAGITNSPRVLVAQACDTYAVPIYYCETVTTPYGTYDHGCSITGYSYTTVCSDVGGGGGGSVGGDGGSGGGGGSPAPNTNPCNPTTGPVAAARINVLAINSRVLVAQPPSTPIGGGGTTNPTPTPTSPCNPVSNVVVNDLKNPCLHNVLQKMLNKSLNGQMAYIINDVFGANDNVNLDFEEFTDPNAKPAKSVVTQNSGSTFSETIYLNLAQVQGSSQEFSAILMVHEVLHAFMNYNNQYYQNQLAQHQAMAQKYVGDVKSFIQQMYNISDSDAYAIILNGLSDAFGNNKPAYLNTLKSQYHVDDPLTTYELERAGLSGTPCN